METVDRTHQLEVPQPGASVHDGVLSFRVFKSTTEQSGLGAEQEKNTFDLIELHGMRHFIPQQTTRVVNSLTFAH